MARIGQRRLARRGGAIAEDAGRAAAEPEPEPAPAPAAAEGEEAQGR